MPAARVGPIGPERVASDTLPSPTHSWGVSPCAGGHGRMGTNQHPHPGGTAPTCQHPGQVEEADAQDAVHHLQGHPDHQLQEGVEPQLLQPARAQQGTRHGLGHTVPSGCPPLPRPGRDLPHVHEHVGEEAPGACPVPGVVDEGALHVLGVVGLQHPLVQPGPVAEEHDDLCQTPRLSPLAPPRCPLSPSPRAGAGSPGSSAPGAHPTGTSTSQLGAPAPSALDPSPPWPLPCHNQGHPPLPPQIRAPPRAPGHHSRVRPPPIRAPQGHTHACAGLSPGSSRPRRRAPHLSEGDGCHEDGGRAHAVLVEVPAPVHLAG